LTVVAPAADVGPGSLLSTGADDDRSLWIAGAALVLGFGLMIVAWHRRPAYSPLTPAVAHSRLLGTRHTSAYERQLRTRGRLVLPEQLSMTPVDSPYFGWRRHAKRVMDVGLVVLTFPITLPLILMIALGVKLTSRGPVFFRHTRVGRHGENFAMLKFRTMYVDALERLRADPDLYETYLQNDFKLSADVDPRIVPFGRFIRRWSLDELPQFFNVLQGRMSLVGPRPIVQGELECYGVWSWAYVEAKPGITGRWQTAGRSFIHYPERAELDADYLEHWTLHEDLRILVKTIPAVLRREGSD
jgi:lipopolysaccharide/colanic/teichoic acid biosynthesis glycosyltransferase